MTDRANVCTPTATGCLAEFIPPGPQRDELLHLVRIAVKFKEQQVGRRRGALAREMLSIARRAAAPLTFEMMLDSLNAAAERREKDGPAASCIERVDRVRGELIYHEPPKVFRVKFKTAQNLMSEYVKKNVAP